MANPADIATALNGYAVQPQTYANMGQALAATDEQARATLYGPLGTPGRAVREGLANYLQGFQQMRDAAVSPEQAPYYIPGVGQAMSANDAYNAAQQGDWRGAAASAFGAIPLIGGMFGGPLAKTADRAALTRAGEMAAAGHAPATIWNETGWFQGADGKWRFEIPDNEAKFTGQVGPTLGDTISHNPLFEAYPELATTEVSRGTSLGKAHYSGGYPEDNIPASITLGSRASFDTLLHEAQHGVSDIEGTATGGNVAMAFGADKKGGAWPLYRERVKAILTPQSLEDYTRAAGFDSTREAEASYKDYVAGVNAMKKKGLPPHLDRMAQQSAAEDYYKKLAGEVEARNVQTRMNMTPEQRRLSPPWETQDIPFAAQILRGVR